MKTYWKNGHGIQVKKINGGDICNLDDTLLTIIYNSLRYYRKHSPGYPGGFESKEQWEKVLKGVEGKFKKVIDTKYSVKEERKADEYLHEAFAALEDVFFGLWV